MRYIENNEIWFNPGANIKINELDRKRSIYVLSNKFSCDNPPDLTECVSFIVLRQSAMLILERATNIWQDAEPKPVEKLCNKDK